MGNSIAQPLLPNKLPSSLESNVLFEKHGIGKGVLPLTLETLKSDVMVADYEWEEEDDGMSWRLNFNYPLLPGILPRSLKALELGANFNQPIEKHVSPKSLIKLWLGAAFNQPLEKDGLPSSLEVLVFSFGSEFSHPLLSGITSLAKEITCW